MINTSTIWKFHTKSYTISRGDYKSPKKHCVTYSMLRYGSHVTITTTLNELFITLQSWINHTFYSNRCFSVQSIICSTDDFYSGNKTHCYQTKSRQWISWQVILHQWPKTTVASTSLFRFIAFSNNICTSCIFDLESKWCSRKCHNAKYRILCLHTALLPPCHFFNLVGSLELVFNSNTNIFHSSPSSYSHISTCFQFQHSDAARAAAPRISPNKPQTSCSTERANDFWCVRVYNMYIIT